MRSGTPYTRHAIAQGKKTLKRLLPIAMQMTDCSLRPDTLNGVLIMPHLTPDNLKSVLFYEVCGGWIADLVLRDGAGLHGHNVLGTQSHAPQPSRALAEDYMVGLLSAILNEGAETPRRTLILDKQ
jgi:hypothetical protein